MKIKTKQPTLCGEIDCIGCFSCEQSCPRHAINMTYNREGYFNPTIDTEKCVNCGICEAHCPVFQLSKRNQDPLKAYASWINDDRIRKESSSGGIFSAIAQNILSQGGIVWGTGYSEDMTPIYKRVENAQALYEIQGSKYVQCKIGGCFKEIREALKDGKKVLFCGTPCHVAGLYSFLGDTSIENLTTIDFICHGVPAPLLFKNYIHWLENKYNDKIINYKFRDEKFGINYNIGTSTVFKGKGKRYLYLTKNSYVLGFCRNMTIHETCTSCKFDGLHRNADFTIGDFHGAKSVYKSAEQFKGISCVIINNEKAGDLLNGLNIFKKEVPIDKIVKTNPNYTHHQHSNNTLDLEYIVKTDYSAVQKKYFTPSFRDLAKCVMLRLLGGRASYIIKNIM